MVSRPLAEPGISQRVFRNSSTKTLSKKWKKHLLLVRVKHTSIASLQASETIRLQ
uniref:Uncharacterized protein n=1 Tax=Solanum tuberosum TaxID=4113 RepID=M1BLC4_SOLTU